MIANRRSAGSNLAQKFDPLARKIARLDRQAGDVAARPREAATKPLPTGSAASANTIGIVVVACLAGGTALPTVTMTSTLSRTNSAANSGNRSKRPSAQRYSIATVAALDPAEFAQPLHESGGPVAPVRRGAGAQESDGRQLAWLLRARANGASAAAPPISVMNSRRPHCTTMFFSLITRPHSAVSSAKNFAASAGVPSIGSSVSFCNRSAISGRFRLSLTS